MKSADSACVCVCVWINGCAIRNKKKSVGQQHLLILNQEEVTITKKGQ